ncbi:MAG: dipicolinate synthase subunit B [Clostridia bacterium]|nr:dipicolinate synthase subunit B [Clostridia bacterium]
MTEWKNNMIGYAFCGSFCTLADSLSALEELARSGEEILPIMSERTYETDTRFFDAEDFRRRVRVITGRNIIHTVKDAEPLGPTTPLSALIIAPCTGNTLAKLATGITDSAVTMAAKAHLRQDRPLLIALASNDAMSQNLGNIGRLLTRRSVYFVPLRQDDPIKKPHSLVADMKRVPEAYRAVREGRQLRPLFV